jgi:hypothetical protein
VTTIRERGFMVGPQVSHVNIAADIVEDATVYVVPSTVVEHQSRPQEESEQGPTAGTRL